MTIVHDVFLVRLQFDFMDGPETVEDQLTDPADLENKKAFPAQQAPREALHLALDLHALCAGQKPVFLHHVFVHAVEFQQHDFAGNRRRQQDFSRSTTGPQCLEEKLLTAQHLPRECPQKSTFHLAFDIDGRRGGDHGAGLGLHRLAGIQIHPHHRKSPGIQNLTLHRTLPS